MNPEFVTELEALAKKYNYHVYGNVVDLGPEPAFATPQAVQANTPTSEAAPADAEKVEDVPAEEATGDQAS